MKLKLFFHLDLIGRVEIHTHSGHGNFDVLIVNGQDLSGDGDVCDMVSEAIGHERYIYAMFDAQESGGEYRQEVA